MRREYQRWYSPNLGRDMELVQFGHAGARVIVFPTSKGRFFDWEDRGMVATLSEQIEAGRLQLFCVDSVDEESWYAYHKPPAERIHRHALYDQYCLAEVLPFSEQQNPGRFVITTGASFGAYHAANFAFRHPDKVNRVLGMSGLYDITRFLDGYYDSNVYFNNPCDYLSNEWDAARLDALRKVDIILATGRDDANRWSQDKVSEVLWSKGVWNASRLWDGWAHDWPYWQKMLTLYIGGHD